MKCPIDNSELMMSDRQGVEIDYCPQCRGIWLDRGELDKIIERSGVPMSAPATARLLVYNQMAHPTAVVYAHQRAALLSRNLHE